MANAQLCCSSLHVHYGVQEGLMLSEVVVSGIPLKPVETKPEMRLLRD